MAIKQLCAGGMESENTDKGARQRDRDLTISIKRQGIFIPAFFLIQH